MNWVSAHEAKRKKESFSYFSFFCHMNSIRFKQFSKWIKKTRALINKKIMHGSMNTTNFGFNLMIQINVLNSAQI
jgi:hypothetical protein